MTKTWRCKDRIVRSYVHVASLFYLRFRQGFTLKHTITSRKSYFIQILRLKLLQVGMQMRLRLENPADNFLNDFLLVLRDGVVKFRKLGLRGRIDRCLGS